jgi:hypothetical protein
MAACSPATTFNQFQHPNEHHASSSTAAAGSVKIELHRQRWGTFAAGAMPTGPGTTGPVPERDAHFISTGQRVSRSDSRASPPRLCSLEAAAQTLRFNLAALAATERGTGASTCAICLWKPEPRRAEQEEREVREEDLPHLTVFSGLSFSHQSFCRFPSSPIFLFNPNPLIGLSLHSS